MADTNVWRLNKTGLEKNIRYSLETSEESCNSVSEIKKTPLKMDYYIKGE